MPSPPCVPVSCAPSPGWGTRLILLALLVLAPACVIPGADLRANCEQGIGTACSDLGTEMLRQGEKQQAENAFARSCEAGTLDDCTLQGQLMLERGELTGAEAPLQKGYEAESQAATYALVDLYQARDLPGDAARARQLRFDAPSINKPDREFIVWWRPSPTGDTSYALAYYFQPMAFWSRRMNLGLHFAGNAHGATELNAAVGYQHFLTPEIVPYGTLLMGGAFQRRSGNVGIEAGVKWCLGPIGHISLGGGTSIASPLHASIGIGINSLPVDVILLLAASAH